MRCVWAVAPGVKAASPVFARHAASLVVVREGSDGPEVLMGVRGSGHRFMPNRLVFPGGAVDPGDGRRVAASELSATTAAMLGRAAGPRLARAIAVAAARELREETGLSLGEPPRLGSLHYLCRAVTPPSLPIRFNARFLVVDASATAGTATDTRELHGVAFRALRGLRDAGLALVTSEVLRQLETWLAEPEAARVSRPLLVFRERSWEPEKA